MYFSLRGLGAVGQWPGSGLQPGHEWVRYLRDADMQWTSCPPGAPYGCTMSGGYAFGQRPEGIGEHNFIYITPQTTTGEAEVTPVADEYRTQCVQDLRNWLVNAPESGNCLNDAEWGQLTEWCYARYRGELSLSDFTSRRASLVESACIRKGCEDFYNAWAATAPEQAACMTDFDRNVALRICAQAETGYITRDEAQRQLYDLIVSACERAASPPPPPPQEISPPPAPPPQTPPGEGVHLPVDETLPPDVLYPPDMPADGAPIVPTSTYLPAPNGDGTPRWVGPVVGIGLIAAVGLTLARMKKRR